MLMALDTNSAKASKKIHFFSLAQRFPPIRFRLTQIWICQTSVIYYDSGYGLGLARLDLYSNLDLDLSQIRCGFQICHKLGVDFKFVTNQVWISYLSQIRCGFHICHKSGVDFKFVTNWVWISDLSQIGCGF